MPKRTPPPPAAPDKQDPETMKIAHLKKELRESGLDTTGLKKTLVERVRKLRATIKTAGQQDVDIPAPEKPPEFKKPARVKIDQYRKMSNRELKTMAQEKGLLNVGVRKVLVDRLQTFERWKNTKGVETFEQHLALNPVQGTRVMREMGLPTNGDRRQQLRRVYEFLKKHRPDRITRQIDPYIAMSNRQLKKKMEAMKFKNVGRATRNQLLARLKIALDKRAAKSQSAPKPKPKPKPKPPQSRVQPAAEPVASADDMDEKRAEPPPTQPKSFGLAMPPGIKPNKPPSVVSAPSGLDSSIASSIASSPPAPALLNQRLTQSEIDDAGSVAYGSSLPTVYTDSSKPRLEHVIRFEQRKGAKKKPDRKEAQDVARGVIDDLFGRVDRQARANQAARAVMGDMLYELEAQEAARAVMGDMLADLELRAADLDVLPGARTLEAPPAPDPPAPPQPNFGLAMPVPANKPKPKPKPKPLPDVLPGARTLEAPDPDPDPDPPPPPARNFGLAVVNRSPSPAPLPGARTLEGPDDDVDDNKHDDDQPPLPQPPPDPAQPRVVNDAFFPPIQDDDPPPAPPADQRTDADLIRLYRGMSRRELIRDYYPDDPVGVHRYVEVLGMPQDLPAAPPPVNRLQVAAAQDLVPVHRYQPVMPRAVRAAIIPDDPAPPRHAYRPSHRPQYVPIDGIPGAPLNQSVVNWYYDQAFNMKMEEDDMSKRYPWLFGETGLYNVEKCEYPCQVIDGVCVCPPGY